VVGFLVADHILSKVVTRTPWYASIDLQPFTILYLSNGSDTPEHFFWAHSRPNNIKVLQYRDGFKLLHYGQNWRRRIGFFLSPVVETFFPQGLSFRNIQGLW